VRATGISFIFARLVHWHSDFKVSVCSNLTTGPYTNLFGEGGRTLYIFLICKVYTSYQIHS
jgi:hypothetical protein